MQPKMRWSLYWCGFDYLDIQGGAPAIISLKYGIGPLEWMATQTGDLDVMLTVQVDYSIDYCHE